MIFSIMTSYTRARAESLIEKCKVGFMERPERIVLFMIGAFTNRMAAVLWVILVLSIVTVADRIYYTWRVLNNVQEGQQVAAGPRPVAGVLLDRRARHLAVRPLGDRHPGVRLAHAARLARRPDGHGPRADRVAAQSIRARAGSSPSRRLSVSGPPPPLAGSKARAGSCAARASRFPPPPAGPPSPSSSPSRRLPRRGSCAAPPSG